MYLVQKKKSLAFLNRDINITGNFLDYEMHINIALKETLDSLMTLKINLGKILKLLAEMPDGRRLAYLSGTSNQERLTHYILFPR